jgi:uncharacterized protein (TIRG00374 family)
MTVNRNQENAEPAKLKDDNSVMDSRFGDRKKVLVIGLQLLGSAGILGLVLSSVASPSEVVRVFSQIQPVWILGALFLVFLSEIMTAYKWRRILKLVGKPPSFLKLLRIHWIGMFYGTFLPGSVSGDAARALLTRKAVGNTAAATAVFMQRNVGLGAMLTLAIGLSCVVPLSLGFFRGWLSWLNWPGIWFMVAALGYGTINLMLVFPRFLAEAKRVGEKFLPAKIHQKCDGIWNSLSRGQSHLRLYWQHAFIPLLLSFITQLIDLAVVLCLAIGLGILPHPATLFQAMTATGLAGMIPISIHGIGLRELGYGLLLSAGTESGQAVALGLQVSLLYLVLALPGGLLHGGSMVKKAISHRA